MISKSGEVKVVSPNLLGITLGVPTRWQSFAGTAYEKHAGVPWSNHTIVCNNGAKPTQETMNQALEMLKTLGAPVDNPIFKNDSNEATKLYTPEPIRSACQLSK